MDNRSRLERQLAWWEKRNEKPLVHVFAPVSHPYGGLDYHVPPGDMVKRKTANLGAQRAAGLPTDNLDVAFVDFGTAFLPALAGAGYRCEGSTSWSIPCAEEAAGLKVQPFDDQHPLWQAWLQRFLPLLENWSWETYLPGPTVMTGPLDILSAMLGPQNLAMELHNDPEAVRAAAMEAARLFVDVYQAQLTWIRRAGLNGGVVDWMQTWMPGDGLCYSEDFSALCGAQHVRDFFHEPNRLVQQALDTPYLHIHSAAHACLPAFFALPRLKALEFSNDPNGPGLDAYAAAGRSIQHAGLCVQLSNWEHPLPDTAIRLLLDAMDPGGFKLTLQASSVEQARCFYEMVRKDR